MTTREMTIAGLVALASAGGVYVLDKSGNNEQVKLLAALTGNTELKDANAAAVLVDDAGRARSYEDGAQVVCKPGGYLDGVRRDDKEWCSDGKGQEWVRDAKGPEVITIVGGKVFSSTP